MWLVFPCVGPGQSSGDTPFSYRSGLSGATASEQRSPWACALDGPIRAEQQRLGSSHSGAACDVTSVFLLGQLREQLSYLKGDNFFRFTCADCSADGKEQYERLKLTWQQVSRGVQVGGACGSFWIDCRLLERRSHYVLQGGC